MSRAGDNGEFFDSEVTGAMIDDKTPYVKPKEGYFNETIKSEKTVLDNAFDEPSVLEQSQGELEVVEAEKATQVEANLEEDTEQEEVEQEEVEPETEPETQEEIDYQAELVKEQQNYANLRKLQDRQGTELGNMRADQAEKDKKYNEAMELLEDKFDIVDGKAVLKKEVLEKATEPTTDDEFNKLIEADNFEGAVTYKAQKIAEKIAEQKVNDRMKEVDDLMEWKAKQEDDIKWQKVSNTLEKQVIELEQDPYFVKNKTGILEVLQSNPTMYETVDNPVSMAYDVFRGRNPQKVVTKKEAPKKESIVGETGKNQTPTTIIDKDAAYAAELRDIDGPDILKTLIGK